MEEHAPELLPPPEVVVVPAPELALDFLQAVTTANKPMARTAPAILMIVRLMIPPFSFRLSEKIEPESAANDNWTLSRRAKDRGRLGPSPLPESARQK
ncbi:MAG: hypothetical protein ACHQ49_05875 [Elusimicrobiota bacterium]